MSFIDPIHSNVLKIVNVIPGSPLTTFEIEPSEHVLKVGDRIKINNLETTPSIAVPDITPSCPDLETSLANCHEETAIPIPP